MMDSVEERAKEFCGYFTELAGDGWPSRPIYPHKSAAAIGGNAWLESAVQPIIPSHDGSDGALQWRDASDVHRLTDLKHWCADHHQEWRTLKAQAEFCICELERDFPSLNDDLRAGIKSLETLTLNFCDDFERPAASGRAPDTRIKFARRCLELIRPAPLPEPVKVVPTQKEPPIMPTTAFALDPILAQLLPLILESIVSAALKTHASQVSGADPQLSSYSPGSIAQLVIKQLEATAPHLFDPTQMAAWIAKAQASNPTKVS